MRQFNPRNLNTYASLYSSKVISRLTLKIVLVKCAMQASVEKLLFVDIFPLSADCLIASQFKTNSAQTNPQHDTANTATQLPQTTNSSHIFRELPSHNEGYFLTRRHPRHTESQLKLALQRPLASQLASCFGQPAELQATS